MFKKKSGSVGLTDRLARIGDRLPVIGHIRRTRTRKSNVLRGLGIILFWVSLLALTPIVVVMANPGESAWPFFIAFLVTFIVSISLMLCFGASKVYHHTDGPLIVILLWISLFIIGMIPYLVAGKCDFINALFESVSGFATVGATIFDKPQELPQSILFWRVLTQWIGGIVIVLLFMVILPMFVPGRRALVTDDIKPLSDNDGVHMKTTDVAKQFVIVYLVLTIIFTVLIWVADTKTHWDTAVQIAMSTISIGGFTPSSDNMTTLNVIQKILVAFMMIVSATNFYLHFRVAVKRELGIYRRDTEFVTMIIWYAILTLFIFIILKDKFVDGFFMLISFATTTGFVSDPDFASWAPGVLILLAVATFIGGCSGSPSGGIKISRVIIIIKSIIIDTYQMVNPSLVQVPKLNGKPVSEKMVHNAYAVFTLTIIVAVVSGIVYAITDHLSPHDAFFTSVSMVSLTGTTTAAAFSTSFFTMSVAGKLFTCVLMVFARMEIIILLAIFMPKFWSEVVKNSDSVKGNSVESFRVKSGETFLDKIKRK